MAAAPHLPIAEPQPARDLRTLLHQTFGHRDFRPHQQPVCEAAASGRDVLLVMPTGAGKSLCYQLPALARGGTALVISPLIALMDDQAHKLAALKLRVARIHSGLPREDLREAARAYLEGRLDFLFIAPERLRVPGFPEMLARRKPALVAIDEAHCISQWGHDFRPDYRTLGQFLPALRPSPIIALTATATPAVQQDILRALNLQDPAVFITGFRRHNLHIEVAETSKPQRLELMRKLLAADSARPAIIYAQSRKAAEEIAGTLNGKYPSAAYHAGLDPGTRDRVQRAFLSGKLDVVVATVAFGMGVDKADVRTVIHAALPGSVEAYYQEIGRAGRDGQPSRVVLLHSFADRRTQEFLLEKNYPPVSDIERILTALNEGVNTLPDLQQHLKLDREVIEQSIDKLLIQSAVAADLDGTLRSTETSNWKANYEQQVGYRRAQIDKIIAYAEGSTCRMAALITHFGDRTDSGRPCGHCDICKPEGTSASDAHQPNAAEKTEIRALLKALQAGPRSAGKICADLDWKDRKSFDQLAEALSRAGLLNITSDSFRTEDGRDITYRKLSLTPEGSQAGREADDEALNTVWLRSEASSGNKSGAPSTKSGAPSSRGKRAQVGPGASDTRRSKTVISSDEPLLGEQAEAERRILTWRDATARIRRTAPFMVLHASTVRALAILCPRNLSDLGTINGLGQEKLNQYGVDLLALCRGEEVLPKLVPSKPSVKPPSSAPKLTGTPQPSLPSERERSIRREAAPNTPISQTQSSQLHSSALLRPAANPPRPASAPDRTLTPAEQQLESQLRTWRSEQATAAGLPSFFVLSDTALKQVALTQPKSLADLKNLPGFGPDKVDRYGRALLSLCGTPLAHH